MITNIRTNRRIQFFALIIGILFILSLIPVPKNDEREEFGQEIGISETIVATFTPQTEFNNLINLDAIAEDGVINVGEYDQFVSIEDGGGGNSLDFYYTINEGTGKIHMGLTAPGTGYVSVGWGASNKMSDADIIWGGFSSDTYYNDTWGNKATDHIIDTTPNIDSCTGSDDGSKTVLECSRSLDTGDTTQDVVIAKDTETTLVMAWDMTSDSFLTTHDYAGDIVHTWTTGVTATVPDAITDLSATPSNGQVSLSWTAPADGGATITDYNVYRSTTQGSYGLVLGSVGSATTSYIDITASNGQLYYYVIKAINSVGEGAQSNEVSATPSTTPDAPTGLTANKGNTHVNISWTAPGDTGGDPITGYNIYRNGTKITTVDISPTTHHDPGLTNGNLYEYTVSANNTNGEGLQSTSASATPSTTPGTPTGLVTGKGDQQIDLSWTPPSNDGGDDITNYKIYVNGSIHITLGNVTTYPHTGLMNGWLYIYTVSAVNLNGEGSQSSPSQATPSTTPDAPTGLGAIKGDGQVSLSWTAPADDGGSTILDYKIYRSETSGSYGVAYDNVGSATTSYVDNGALNGVEYFYVVKAENNEGEGSQSIEVSATPSTTPDAPTGLSATKGDQTVDLSWNPPSDTGGNDITGYNIYRNGSLHVPNVQTTTYQDSGLENGKLYNYTVSAINDNGEGSPSSSASAIPSTTPGNPTTVSANSRQFICFVKLGCTF